MTERHGNPYDQLPEGPRSDLGNYLYGLLLKGVTKGLISTTYAATEFAAKETPQMTRRMCSAVGKLSRISAAAARGQIDQVNVEFLAFQSPDYADALAAAISKKGSEILPVSSSITSPLHHGHVSTSDGMARESLIPSLRTLVTEVHLRRSNKKLYTVRLVGVARLTQPG